MTWINPVVWQEGMFLRAQHFQQQSRWTEAQARARLRATGPWWWGVSELRVDAEKLDIGQFAVAAAQGLFPDGAPFSIPGDAEPPEALNLDERARRQIVHLCLPDPALSSPQVSDDIPGATGRFRVREFEAADTFPAEPDEAGDSAVILVGKPRLRLMLESEDRNGWLCIPIARIEEVGADKKAKLDEEWIPPVLRFGASPKLIGFVDEVLGGLTSRIDDLANALGETLPQTPPGILDFQRLQAANRWQKLLAHWTDAAAVHPEAVYAAFVQMAAELATFSEPTHRLPAYPPYRHDDLQRCFARPMADLRRVLAWMRDTGAERIALQQRANWFRGRVHKQELLRTAVFYLVAKADMPVERLRRDFPSQVKIGALRQLESLVTSAISGIAVSPVNPPPQIPFQPGTVYFELDRSSPYWDQARQAAELGLHVSDMFPNIALELWAVRS
jgi:type VI secretion system protein ImpJ